MGNLGSERIWLLVAVDERLIRTLLSLALIAFAGCGPSTAVGGLVFVLLAVLGLSACGAKHEGPVNCEHGIEDQQCVDGKIKVTCCPSGVSCNYGQVPGFQVPFIDCGGGTCVDRSVGQCPIDECEGSLERGCVNGRIMQLCCPDGVACNYGQNVIDCGNGACTTYGESCP